MSNVNAIPLSYHTPPFPSLYWPFHPDPNEPKYLYTLTDIWKFTLYWTLITTPLAHLVVAAWAVFMQFLAARDRARYLATFDDKSSDRNDEGSSDDETQIGTGVGGANIDTDKSLADGEKRRRKVKSKGKPTLSVKNRKLLGSSPYRAFVQYAGLIFAVYIVVGAIEALIAGSLVGVVLGALYNAGYFRMSVWTPLFWGIVNMLVLILSSFRISGGM